MKKCPNCSSKKIERFFMRSSLEKVIKNYSEIFQIKEIMILRRV